MLEEAILSWSEGEPLEGAIFKDETVTDLDMSNVRFDSVQFINCRFISSRFVRASFYDSILKNCDLSNCDLSNSYWKGTVIQESKAVGSNFDHGFFRETKLTGGVFNYSNYGSSVWESCAISECDIREAFLSEAKFKKIRLTKVDFTRTSFFKTPLKNVDLSDCVIDGFSVSDDFRELRGAKLNALQAVGIASMMGIKVV